MWICLKSQHLCNLLEPPDVPIPSTSTSPLNPHTTSIHLPLPFPFKQPLADLPVWRCACKCIYINVHTWCLQVCLCFGNVSPLICWSKGGKKRYRDTFRHVFRQMHHLQAFGMDIAGIMKIVFSFLKAQRGGMTRRDRWKLPNF